MADIRNQVYGVEVEMVGLSRESACRTLARHWGVEPEYYGGSYGKWFCKDQKGRKWTFMSDASICGIGNEMVTPVLGWDDIELLQDAIRTLRTAGGKADTSCGIHVHVGADEHTPKTLKNLLNVGYTHYELLKEALGFGYRSGWCAKHDQRFINDINTHDVKSLDKLSEYWYGTCRGDYYGKVSKGDADNAKYQHYNSSRYHLVNLHSYFQGKGVEFRAFNSTMHAGEIKAYVQFCCALNATAINCRYCTYRNESATDKKTMESWLKALGLTGDEFKTCRLHMTKNLH